MELSLIKSFITRGFVIDLILTRLSYRDDGIFGELRDLNDVLIAVSLERAYPNDSPDGYSAKIPQGSYMCVRGIHQLEHMRTPFETFEVTGVVGHFDILFHFGNWNDDSSGCVLLGESLSPSARGQMITNSKQTFDQFMLMENGADTFGLTVLG